MKRKTANDVYWLRGGSFLLFWYKIAVIFAAILVYPSP